MQKCCTVPKKQKKTMFLDQWPWMLVPARLASGQWSRNIVFFVFCWYSTSLLVEMIGFFGTVHQKLRFELQKPIKPYGFIGFSRRQSHFIGTVQQNWSLELQKPIKTYGFCYLFHAKLHFCCTVPIKWLCHLEKPIKPCGFIGF